VVKESEFNDGEAAVLLGGKRAGEVRKDANRQSAASPVGARDEKRGVE
jgi:hypothetical protein